MGGFFSFSKILIYGAWDEFFTIATIGPLSCWINTEVVAVLFVRSVIQLPGPEP